MSFNDSDSSPAYVGYMYNPNTALTLKNTRSIASGALFGNNVTYSNGTYTLVNTATSYNDTHHYSCNNTTGTCSTVRYYFYEYDSYYAYLELNGNFIDDALEKMLSANDINQEDSAIKAYIDYWYGDSLGDFTDKIEDTIYCNDRSIKSLGAFDPNEPNSGNDPLVFKGYNREDLGCTNITDKFSVVNNKAKLTYPVGLLTKEETDLLYYPTLLNTGIEWWLLTPEGFGNNGSTVKDIDFYGYNFSLDVNVSQGVRPAISLKPGTVYISGDGSRDNPYVVE